MTDCVAVQQGTNFTAIEDLAHAHGVDLHIAGHVHICEATDCPCAPRFMV